MITETNSEKETFELGKKIGDVVSVEGINQVNDFRVIDVQRK